MVKKIISLLILIQIFGTVNSQKSYRPDFFFREDWKETPAEIPLSQKHVNNPELLVNLYGAGKDSLKKATMKNQLTILFTFGRACVWEIGW
ncbi:hypothetical protein MASR2M47_29250 [Draconibacterium sp.]